MLKLNYKPLEDRIIIRPDEIQEKTESGLIYLPQSSQGKQQKGEVIEIGPGTKDIEIKVKPGDKVLYSEFTGIPFKEGGVDYLIMRSSDLLATV